MTNGELYKVEIVSQAPTRISLAGGGTDISPYPELHGGAVVSTTISIFMSVRLRIRTDGQVVIHSNTRPEPMVYQDVKDLKYDGKLDFIKAAAKFLYRRSEGFELYLYSPLPMCSGLGGSGAMCVALLDAFNHIQRGRMNSYEIAEMAYQIETKELGNASGRQDQYASAFGGFNHIEFLGNNHVRVNRLDIQRGAERALNQALGLLWMGERQASGQLILDQSRAMTNNSPALEALHRTKARVIEMCDALVAGDVPRIGELLDTLWQEKRRFSEGVSNPPIDEAYAKLREAGMIGGKICGAGGGGHMLVCCEIDRRDDVLSAAEQMGLRYVPFTFMHEGVMSWQSMLRTVDNGGHSSEGAFPG